MSGKKSSKRPSIKQDPAVQERIAAAALEHPDFGIRRLARLLKNEGIKANETAIRSTLQEQGLHPCKLRLSLLEKRHLNEGLQLSEEQQAALEAFNPSLRKPEIVPPIAAVLPETPEKSEEPEPEPVIPVALPTPAPEKRVVKVPAAPAVSVQVRGRMRSAGMNRWIFRAFKAALVCVAIYLGVGTALKIRSILHQEPEYRRQEEGKTSSLPPTSSEALLKPDAPTL